MTPAKASVILKTCAYVAIFITGSGAVTSEILQPIRSSGAEVALIFVPGAMIRGEAYRNTARAIQCASEMRLWIALTGNYSLQTPNPAELPGAIEGAMMALQKAGMKGNNYVGVAHSLGGIFLSSYAKGSPLKAIVLLGAYLNRGTKLREYPIPVLTLSGELDGQARITRIAVDYEQLQQDAKKTNSALYRTPVINIKGSCHGQFASGPMPLEVRAYDIKPDVTDAEAHQEIGRHVGSFIAATFGTVASHVEQARENLTQAFYESGRRFQPLLNIKALDINGTTSPWSVYAQGQIVGKLLNRTEIINRVETNPAFTLSKPSIKPAGSGIIINTTTLVDYPSNPMDVSIFKESPVEIDIKLRSREVIRHVLKSLPRRADNLKYMYSDDDGPTCRTFNEAALALALNSSTVEAQRRYRSRGRPLTFTSDLVYGNGLQWTAVPLQITEDDAGLHVQSVALLTPLDSPVLPGEHYCKVLSPYRAMEWINVDSLREHAPPML